MISGDKLDPGPRRRGGGRTAAPLGSSAAGAGCRASLAPTARRGPAAAIASNRITQYRVTTLTMPSGTLMTSVNHQLRGIIPVRSPTYEITFSGQAGRTLRAQFDDCQVTICPDTTTLRAELPDQAALPGLVERIVGLGLEIIDVHLVTQPPAP